MATRKAPAPEPRASLLTRPPAEVLASLSDRIEFGKKLHDLRVTSPEELTKARGEYYKWDAFNAELIKQHGLGDDVISEYTFSVGFGFNGGLREDIQRFHDDIDYKLRKLDSIRERIPLYPVAPSAQATQARKPHNNKRIFVVHGHDDATREAIARFIERLGFEAVVLHEQASGGRTIIEKLEFYSDVSFAVVLLTPDDAGGIMGSAELQPRARQNVVLELGYFVGKLGRERVCALHRAPLELPSDVLGVVYVPLDSQHSWQISLAKELKLAGFAVDMNDVI